MLQIEVVGFGRPIIIEIEIKKRSKELNYTKKTVNNLKATNLQGAIEI